MNLAVLHQRLTPLLQRLPITPLNHVFALSLSRVLSEPIREGQLDFLNKRCCAIVFTDLALTLKMGLQQQRFYCPPQTPDVTISADCATFLQMAAKQVDPDTLFFQRRLLITGDTELGLYIKNFLDRFEFTTQQRWMESAIQQVAMRW
jgi:predicted lipid carrier protein YhbT